MAGAVRHGLVGIAVGLAGAALAAILLSPKRRDSSPARPGISFRLDSLLDTGQSGLEGAQAWWRRATHGQTASGLLPDERVTQRIRSELARIGIWTPRLDVNTVDGTVYLRGREPDAARVETILSRVHEVPGVLDVVDEIRRE